MNQFVEKEQDECLKKEEFKAYLNEYKTSNVCPTCNSALETFKGCINPRSYQQKKNAIAKSKVLNMRTLYIYNQILN